MTQITTEPPKDAHPQALCTSRLAANIMLRHQDEWIVAVAIATTKAQSAISTGASEATAHAIADQIIADYKIVDAELLRCIQSFRQQRGEDHADADNLLRLRCSVIMALDAGQTTDYLIKHIYNHFYKNCD